MNSLLRAVAVYSSATMPQCHNDKYVNLLQCMAVIFSLMYWRQPLNQLSVNNINGSLFLMLTQMTFGFAFNVIMVWLIKSKKSMSNLLTFVWCVYFLSSYVSGGWTVGLPAYHPLTPIECVKERRPACRQRKWDKYTMWGKKTALFYFCNIFIKPISTLIIFGTHIP